MQETYLLAYQHNSSKFTEDISYPGRQHGSFIAQQGFIRRYVR
jgi:hypothetical protein